MKKKIMASLLSLSFCALMSVTACTKTTADNTNLLLMLGLKTIYTAGNYNDGSKNIPCYWTGTTRTNLADDGTHTATVNSIFVE
jgi:hypothetical protein